MLGSIALQEIRGYYSRLFAEREFGMPQGTGGIAQLVEQLTLNQLVLGSSPSAPTNEFKQKGQSSRIGLFAFLLYAGVT